MQVIELFDSTKLAGAAALYNVLSLKESAGSGYLQKKKIIFPPFSTTPLGITYYRTSLSYLKTFIFQEASAILVDTWQ